MTRMNRHLKIFIITLVWLGLTARAFCYTAEVTDISGTKYFPAVKEALLKAEKSIKLVMFTIESSLYRKDSKVNQLLDELIAAKQRGVDVEVVLDQNVDFVQRRRAGEWETLIKSIGAYKRLKEAGIKVFYDEPVRYTHAKAVIIDKKLVVLGSTNWTESAFDRSIEASVLVNSEGLANELLSYFTTIKIDTGIEKYLDFIGPSTPIAWEFMENQRFAPLMIKRQSQRAFEVYLFLLWQREVTATSRPVRGTCPTKGGTVSFKLTLFYDTLAQYLGIYEGWNTTAYRKQIMKVLTKLEREYKLIKFEPRYAKEAEITLLSYEKIASSPACGEALRNDSGEAAVRNDSFVVRPVRGTGPTFSGKLATGNEEGALDSRNDYFELPNDYFKFEWNKVLSFRAQFCYLINLANSSVSDTKPFWSKSVIAITDQFGGVGADIIHKGMLELRRKKLVEITYDELNGRYEERRPKVYKILPLYDPKELEVKLRGIEDKYGKEAYGRARKYAEIVFEENNPEVIEDIILKTKQYGDKKIKQSFDIVAQKSIDNPKRSYGYVVGILEQLGVGK